ncbi:hypothetical protein [Prevotella sp. AGR2160]|nr:hypothetical protein [Prevotella sp. AGR2160]
MAGAPATDITYRAPGDSVSSPLSVLEEGEHLPRMIPLRGHNMVATYQWI